MSTTVQDFSRVRLSQDGAVATLTLNHTEVLNSISSEMLAGINDALDEIEDPARGVRCGGGVRGERRY